MQAVLFLAVALTACVHANEQVSTDESLKTVVMVVDPAWDDVAGYMNHIPLLRKFRIVKVMTRLGESHSFLPGHMTPFRKFTYQSEHPDPIAAAKEICPQLKKYELSFPIEAVMPTSDGAVPLTDQIAHCLGKRGNPATGPLANARRNKWDMHDAMVRAGLRTMLEKVVSSWEEASTYIETMWDPPLSEENPCVFKILQGSGGEGTVKVTSMRQGKEIFDKLVGSTSATADVNTKVLVQEYLQGTEYAIDSVSRNGVNKIVAVWIEDFRPANGIFDQYYGFKLQDPEDPKIKKIIEYGLQILDATGLRNGAANTEIKWLDNKEVPCLMEINARWAGINWGDGLTIEDTCVGKNIIEAAFESYLDEEAFDSMPVVRPMTCHAAIINAINFQEGILRGIPGLEFAKSLPTYLSSDVDSAGGLKGMLGKVLPLTQPTAIPVNIAFASHDQAAVYVDYDRMIQLEKENKFFDISPVMLTGSLAARGFPNERRMPLPLAVGVLSLGGVAVFIVFVSKQRATTYEDYITLE